MNICYDGANRESQVGGNCAAPGLPAYMTGGQYAAHGDFAQYQYGNGVQRNVGFNSRLQPLTLADQLNTQTLFNLSLNWGATKNNGNLQSATYANGGLTFTDNFSYDGVNRLLTANDSGGWSRTFTYDAFGNMTAAGNPGVTSLPFNGNNQIVGASYDQAGNQLKVNGNSVAYDFENHIANETDGVSQAVETYVYDGDGRRVEKYGPGGTPRTVFVYDALGRLAAEYNSTATVPPCITCYLSDDHLGTPRLITDSNGLVAERHDYLPFGEEVAAGTFGRNQTYGSTAGVINQKFTGKERDSESGLDYFGARYYGSALGRFTSPDKPLVDQFVYNPQSWNLYTYVRNNPLAFIDPTGNCSQGSDGRFHDDPGSPCVKPGDNSTTVYANEDIANAARSQVGSWSWLQRGQKGNFACNTNKCNLGVADWITLAGKSRPSVPKRRLSIFGIEFDLGSREPTAHDWADPTVHIDGWSDPVPAALAVPGDVIAQAHGDFGHVGIVADPGQTVSVNSTTTPAGIVTENNWGFRTGPIVNGEGPNGESRTDKPPVVRKYIGNQ